MRVFKKSSGIGLLELMLVLAIISVIILLAMRYFTAVRGAQQVSEAVKIIQSVYTAGNIMNNNGITLDPTDAMKQFVERGYVPAMFSGPTANPWQGAIKANGVSSKQLNIVLTSVPKPLCLNLEDKLENSLPDLDSIDCGSCPNDLCTVTTKVIYP